MPSAAVDQSGGAIDGAVVGAFSGLWVDEEVVAEQSRGVVASFERSEPGEVLGGNARASTSGPVADSKLKYMPQADRVVKQRGDAGDRLQPFDDRVRVVGVETSGAWA